MKVPSPETYTLTKTVPFHQSKEVSKFIWRLHQECRWYFNKGVKMSFDNRNLTKFDIYGTVTMLRNNTGWNAAYSQMQRASIDDGRKTVRLHQSAIDRKNRMAKRRQKEGKRRERSSTQSRPNGSFERNIPADSQRCGRSRN